MASPEQLLAAVAAALRTTVVASWRLGGGDVAESFRLELDDGRTVFAKTHRSPPPQFFDTEARGLGWLRDAGTVAVPDVLAAGEAPVPFLVLSWVDEGGRALADESEFGRALAALHRSGAPCYGRSDRRPTSSRQLPNDPCNTWSEFYGARRLQPLAQLAHDSRALEPTTIRSLERLAFDLDRFGLDEAPSRLHGDLWAGNRLVDASGVSWLIDPAAHGGHREFDLAMMRLFGGFGEASFAAYHEVHPLAAGWADRVPLHQIAPLVVHAIKFGGGYGPAAAEAIGRYC